MEELPASAPSQEDLLARVAIERGVPEENVRACQAEALAIRRTGKTARLEQLLLRGRMIDTGLLADLLGEVKWRSSSSPLMTRYEVETRIGEGAAAVVYRARERATGSPVAIKVLRKADEVHRKRFAREASALARIAHPNVLAVIDGGVDGDRMYLLLEYVEGDTLDGLLAAKRLERRTAVALLAKVARGVQAAHEKGIVHRDLKPANILVTPDGTPKVADFGLVRLVDSSTALTAPGSCLGSPTHMAPEQVKGELDRIGPVTDVYALGAILYHILTGRPPCLAPTLAQTFNAILERPPEAPRRIDPDIPGPLQDIALRALAKDGDERHPSAAAFALDLETFLVRGTVASPQPASPSPQPAAAGRGRALVVAGACAALVLAAAAAWLLLH